jgi:hypothetical protein
VRKSGYEVTRRNGPSRNDKCPVVSPKPSNLVRSSKRNRLPSVESELSDFDDVRPVKRRLLLETERSTSTDVRHDEVADDLSISSDNESESSIHWSCPDFVWDEDTQTSQPCWARHYRKMDEVLIQEGRSGAFDHEILGRDKIDCRDQEQYRRRVWDKKTGFWHSADMVVPLLFHLSSNADIKLFSLIRRY